MSAGSDLFPSTAWAKIWLASREGPGASGASLNALANAYAGPLRKLAIVMGMAPPESEDTVQELMVDLFAAKTLGRLGPARGRFRDYLRRALEKKWLTHWRKAYQQCRDVRRNVPLDGIEAKLPTTATPLMEELDGLRAEECLAAVKQRMAADAARADLFENLWQEMVGGESANQATMAGGFHISPEAYRKRLQELRKRLLKEFTAEVAKGVYDPADLVDDVRYLLRLAFERTR